MAKGFELGAAMFGAGVVVGAVGLPAVPATPHLTTYAAVAGVSVTMSGDGPVESLDPLTVVVVLVIAVVVAVLMAVITIAVRPTDPEPGRGTTDGTGGAARRSGVRRMPRS